MGGDLQKVVVHYDSHDALATTHESQGSDLGMKGGILGFEAFDQRLLQADKHMTDEDIVIHFEVGDSGRNLPNMYRVELLNENEEFRVEAVSTGGGMIRLLEINGTAVSMEGDCYEVLLWSKDENALQEIRQTAHWAEEYKLHHGPVFLLELRSVQAPDPEWLRRTGTLPEVFQLRVLKPVLPILSLGHSPVPFASCKEMLKIHGSKTEDPWKAALSYESARGRISEDEVRKLMDQIYEVMRTSVETGLQGTEFKDRIFGAQSPGYKAEMEKGNLSNDHALHRITLYVSAIMEVKSSMGVIVAAPTAGSCGTFAGAVLGLADSMNKSKDEVVQALLSGSLVGVFIAGASTFSAEIGGCQAECGSGAGMAAAALVTLLGGNLEQGMAAASMALQNSLGMICDPIAARVEAPCLGKNVSSAANALSCANMVMAGYDPLIPLDEVIETMDKVGRSLPHELRCTALGGLALTPTAREIEKRLGK